MRSGSISFTLTDCDVELLAERGIAISHKTVRCRILTFGSMFARNFRWLRLNCIQNRCPFRKLA